MRIKKKDFKKTDYNKLSELVNSDGSPIDGDEVGSGNSEIETAPNQTPEDYANSAIQPTMDYARNQSRIGESKDKMAKIIEDLVKNNNKDSIFNKPSEEGIGNIDNLNGSIINKVKGLVEATNSLDGDSIAIVLNYILENLTTDKIPHNLSKILRSKI